MSNSPELWRVFCAIELPQSVCNQALDHINKLRERFPQVRVSWTKPGKFHLTLKFLGDIQRERALALANAASRTTMVSPPFPLVINGSGVFPERGPAKVLWAGIDDHTGGLAALHSVLETECAAAGFGKEARAFHPHLTLARLRDSGDARTLSARHKEIGFASQEFLVTKLLVIRSELSSAGSNYTTISRHTLGGA